jgi:hypothetical protein
MYILNPNIPKIISMQMGETKIRTISEKGKYVVSNIMRSWFLSIWYLLDPIYFSFTRLAYVKDEREQNLIFRVRDTIYRGREIILSDGTVIQKNDRLLKIHLHNAKLLKDLHPITCEVARGRYIFQSVLASLPALAAFVEGHPHKEDLKGIIGITTLHRGCRRLGFETHEIKSRYYQLYKKITFILIIFLSTSSFSKQSIQKQQPKYLFMSTEGLYSRYKEN